MPKKLSIGTVITTVEQWLMLPDVDVVRVVLAAVIANRLAGDSLWLFVIAPPGGGKTELLNALGGAPDIYPLSDLTPQTFLSGKQGDSDASLLPKLSDTILILKDFTTVLTMHRDARQQVLAQLREIYDGSYIKAFGTGKILRWQGKVGFIAGVTPVIDHHHAVSQVLGERFIQFRLAAGDGKAIARSAMRHRGREREMRAALRDIFAAFLAARTAPDLHPVEIPEAVEDAIADLAVLVVRARSGIIRDAFSTREIELVPEPEAPTRLAKQLATFAVSVALVEDAATVTPGHLALVARLALDCIPRPRFLALRHLAGRGAPETTSVIAGMIDYPTSSTRRVLEDLAALGVLVVQKAGPGRPDLWRVADAFGEVFRAALARASGTLPEVSEGHNTLPLLPPSDISGKVVDSPETVPYGSGRDADA
ncbi:MAG: hypothetical protein ACRDHY_17195 [Anaerolineales bacterium]